MYDELVPLLSSLDGVRQNPKYHPEGDALFHSLQVFDCARYASDDRQLWAAALLHDVGKVLGSEDHDETGADLLDGVIHPRVVFLVRHHLDLLRDASRARRRFAGTPWLPDLTLLRRWDLAGRSPTRAVLSIHDALDLLLRDGGERCLEPDHDLKEEA